MQAAPDAETAERLRNQGIDERDITNKTAMVYSLYEQAMKGNVKAFEALMKYSGEDPDQLRKDMELQFKREIHIITLNDKDYSGFKSINIFGDDEKQQVLLAVQKNYKELKEAHADYVRNNVTYIDELDDDDDDDE